MTQRWGATPEQWAALDVCAGLTADLLPVVSNPAAEISPASKMQALGKTPSLYNAARKVIGIPKWTQKRATGREVERWSKEPDYGICIQTGALCALDIDVEDREAAGRISAAIAAALGAVPRRFRANSGKCLFAFRIAGATRGDGEGVYTKRAFRTDGGLVEFLAAGQQFVAGGTHSSGVRYEWDGGFPDDFPTVAAEAFERLWAALVSEFASAEPTGGVLRRRGETLAGIADEIADWLLDRGKVIDQTGDSALCVECPQAHLHTTDNGPTQTVWFPAGSNGYERGHFCCLHAHCADLGTEEYLRAVGYYAEDFAELAGKEIAEAGAEEAGEIEEIVAPGFVRDGKGRIEALLDNVMKAIEAPDWLGTDFAYDEFHGSIVVSPHDQELWRPLEDADYVTIRRHLETHGFKPIGRELMRDAVLGVAWKRRFDSAKAWLEGLEWDGVPRVETMLSDYFGAEDTPYTRAVARYWFSAHAGRVFEPGSQADMVPVLVGRQNAGKSSAVLALSPSEDAYVKLDLEHKDADLARKMRGKVIGELDELRGFSGRTAEANKAWITQRFEEWTPKYQEFTTKLLRRLVFVGTSNPDDFLDDPTGERRWLPVRIGKIRRAELAALRDQFWAEGAALWRANGIMWQAAFELAQAIHADFKKQDTWAEAVIEWVAARIARGETCKNLSIQLIFLEVLQKTPSQISPADDARMRKILQTCGFLQVRPWGRGPRPRLWSFQSTSVQPIGEPFGLDLC